MMAFLFEREQYGTDAHLSWFARRIYRILVKNKTTSKSPVCALFFYCCRWSIVIAIFRCCFLRWFSLLSALWFHGYSFISRDSYLFRRPLWNGVLSSFLLFFFLALDFYSFVLKGALITLNVRVQFKWFDTHTDSCARISFSSGHKNSSRKFDTNIAPRLWIPKK